MCEGACEIIEQMQLAQLMSEHHSYACTIFEQMVSRSTSQGRHEFPCCVKCPLHNCRVRM